MARLGDRENFGVFLVNFSKIWVDFFSGQYFIFSGQKTVKMIISGHSFTIGQHWFFKSVYLATNILYLMLEHYLKNYPPPKNNLPNHRVPPMLTCVQVLKQKKSMRHLEVTIYSFINFLSYLYLQCQRL